MTPQEAQRVADLFERLASLESRPRDAEAERLIADGLRRAPNAVYALVQTALVQDDALRQADARIRELEDGGAAGSGGFLDNMRDTLFGGGRTRNAPPQGPAQGTPMGVPPGFGTSQARPDASPAPQAPQQGGGSFLGTAAAAAAGVIGGSLLLDSIRTMTGGQRQSAADSSASNASPWGGNDASGSNLARDAGADDVGRGGRDHAQAQHDDQASYDTADLDDDDDFDGDDPDMDFDIGDIDFA
jgi:hypothetical protein